MIEELDILNGVLDIKFNPYIYEYTVNVDDNINELEFSYVLNEDANIEIRNNNLDDNNTIYVDVYNIDNTITYTLPNGAAFTSENGVKNITITLTWANSDSNNAADTALGIAGGTISVPVTFTAQQHIAN